MEERCQLLGERGFHLPVLQLGQGAAIRRICLNRLLVDGKIRGSGNHLVDVAHCLGIQPFGLLLGPNPLSPTAVQQLFVGFLQVQRGQSLSGIFPFCFLSDRAFQKMFIQIDFEANQASKSELS